MIVLPKSLLNITKYLNSQNLTTILIGGAVRDSFFNLTTTDFDIEVYGCEDIKQLQQYLSQFGKVDTKGSKFGILSINIDSNSYDFALPRTETKISKGHYGFEITTHKILDYDIAFKRRDFTINAIGYNLSTQEFIDPFNGIKDLKNKLLKHIDKDIFIEDPLRVYRAMQFLARFDLSIYEKTLELCIQIVNNNSIQNLTKNKIQKEFNKLNNDTKCKKIAIDFLNQIGLEYNHYNLS